MASTGSRFQLAEHVRRLRLERSWSQTQLAEVSGLSLRTIQRLERAGNCSHETLMALALAFEIDVRDLTRVLYGETSLPETIPQSRRAYRSREIMGMRSKFGSEPGRLIVAAGILYFLLLAVVIAFAVGFFGSHYGISPVPRNAETLELHQGYDQFLRVSGLVLALYVGILAGVAGLHWKNVSKGLIVLGGGILASTLGYSDLPWVLFKFDQYSPGFLWLIGNIGPIVVSWSLVTILGRILWKESVARNATASILF